MVATKRKYDGTRHDGRRPSSERRTSEDCRTHGKGRPPPGKPLDNGETGEQEAPRKRTPRRVDANQHECPICQDFQAATETGLIRHCLKDIRERVNFECSGCGEVKKATEVGK